MRNPIAPHRLQLALAVLATSCVWTFLSSSPAVAAKARDKCEASKLKAAGKACGCRLTTAAKAVLKGGAPDFGDCASDLTAAFVKAQDKAAGACPNEAEDEIVDGRLTTLADDVIDAVEAASATGPAAAKCVAGKLKAAGKQCACMHKAQAKAAIRNAPPDFSKCDAKLVSAFEKIEAKAAGACPTTGDASGLNALLDETFDEIEADIANVGTEEFARPGPYRVGIRTLTLVDSTRPTAPNGTFGGAPERTLVTEIWYPAETDSFGADRDAPFVAGTAAFPIVLRAHGLSGFRTDSTYLGEHLASHGYVVVSPDFPLSNLEAPGGPTLADVGNQALDLGFLLDEIIALSADPASFLFGRVDSDTVGAIGHSLGGATVLLATYHADLRDPRIDATVGLAPLACVFLDGFFDSTATPLMIQGGTYDLITGYASNQLMPYGLVNAPKYLLELTGGFHMGFSNRLFFGPFENGDDVLGCSFFVPPGGERPVVFEANLPPDFLGGPAAFVDPTGSACEPVCPLAEPGHMFHARQIELSRAGSTSFFDAKLRGSVAGGRMITGKIDAENDDAALFYEE